MHTHDKITIKLDSIKANLVVFIKSKFVSFVTQLKIFILRSEIF